MSRYIEVYLEVKNYDFERVGELNKAIEDTWNFSSIDEYPDGIQACEAGTIGGGKGEDVLAKELSEAIWKANGGYCNIMVRVTFLEQAPYEDFTFDEYDWEKSKKSGAL